ncbi:uncharacterized protein c20orf24 homolog [Phtheirospermum japonicum]|uniref:Uncharacterized protein c20orf24 homolog n=1 Tax=Phtheirospermum japonicum TaxID=374723 RepID=A0A830C6Q6_9LAMI|nr:uncharacterized protein c20orf24 homolog [Phtheirospermum japonicum]
MPPLLLQQLLLPLSPFSFLFRFVFLPPAPPCAVLAAADDRSRMDEVGEGRVEGKSLYKMRERKLVKLSLQLQQQQQHQDGHLSPFKLSKLLDPDASWDKDQLGDVLHWIRQALALVCGLLWGSIPLVGGIWFLLFVVFSSGIIYGYYALLLKIDEDEFGGHGALLQEGLFASVSLFLWAFSSFAKARDTLICHVLY